MICRNKRKPPYVLPILDDNSVTTASLQRQLPRAELHKRLKMRCRHPDSRVYLASMALASLPRSLNSELHWTTNFRAQSMTAQVIQTINKTSEARTTERRRRRNTSLGLSLQSISKLVVKTV